MSEFGSNTVLVYDHGLFLPLAQKLVGQFGRVLYATPFERGFPLITEGVIGDNYEGIERCNDVWAVKDEVDLFVFPDIQHAGLQTELESQGKLVWGSRYGDSLELSRVKFLETLKEIGLPCPKYEVVVGLESLRDNLKANEDRWIKISRWRGTMETWHHNTYEQSEPKLDKLSVKLGPIKNLVQFMVFEPVESDLEVGYDGYCIDGKFPSLAVQGYESKDRGYIATLQKYQELPELVREVNDAFGPW